MIHPSKALAGLYKRTGELEKSSFLLFIIMMAGNFLNYVFQIIMGNQLNVEDYGRLSAILSIIAILSVVSGIITMVTAKYTVEYVQQDQLKRVRYLIFSMFKILTAFAVLILLIGTILAPWISRELKIDNNVLVVYTIISAAISLFASVVLGVLQGLKRFFHYGITFFLTVLGKLIFSIFLVAIGWRLFGPVTAIILGIVISLGYSLFQIRDKIKVNDSDESFKFNWSEFFRFSGKVLVIQVCISIITNGDILLVKYYFSSQDAGLYSSAMVIGKISLYAATAIVAALFPMTMEHVAKGLNSKHLLIKSLLYSGGIAILCALVLNLFSDFVIKLLYGLEYISSAALLLPISAMVVPITFFTIMMNYQLATGKTRALSITLVGCILGCGILVQLFHSSIALMIYCIAAVLAIGVIIDIIFVLLSGKKILEGKA